MKLDDATATAVELACLTTDRSNAEQHALLRVALRIDLQRNRQTVTNRRVGPPSQLTQRVLDSRVLCDDQTEVTLPERDWLRLRRSIESWSWAAT